MIKHDWVPCSPEWKKKHPDGCKAAPLLAGRPGGPHHYHPEDWSIADEFFDWTVEPKIPSSALMSLRRFRNFMRKRNK